MAVLICSRPLGNSPFHMRQSAQIQKREENKIEYSCLINFENQHGKVIKRILCKKHKFQRGRIG